MRRVVSVVLAVLIAAGIWQFATSRAASDPEVTIYDPSPSHPWNRLFAALVVREDHSGNPVEANSIDPLLWGSSVHLLEAKSHRRAICALDDFLQSHAENLSHDPLKRALLIRDLWAVFDWSVAREPFRPGQPEFRNEKQGLQTRLAEVMRRLALTEKEMVNLPDNYAQAAASGAFPKEYDPNHSDLPFLPPDLFDQHGPWIQLSGTDGPPAISHLRDRSGRSRFLIFLRLPGGRKAGFDYLRELWNFSEPWVIRTDAPRQTDTNPLLPSFPARTEVAMVRQMTLFDNAGNLTPAPITESIQIRVFRSVTPESSGPTADFALPAAGSGQQFFEIRLDRSQLLDGKSGGLRAVSRDERELSLFNAMPFDQVDDPAMMKHWNQIRPTLQKCGECHRGAGINSLNSRSILLKPNFLQKDADYELPTRWWEDDGTVEWKKNRYEWGLLNGYWTTSQSR